MTDAESSPRIEPSQATIITEHPIPLDEDRAEQLQETNPMFQNSEGVLHPDELHERYQDVLAENDEWRVFRSHLYGHSGYVFLWNHQLGYGIRFHDDEGAFRNFVHAMMLTAERVVDSPIHISSIPIYKSLLTV